MNHYIILSACLLALPLSAQSGVQLKDSTLSRTVVVEQAYNPDIIDASKINLLPEVEEPKSSNKQVEYASVSLPASEIPAEQMEAYNVPVPSTKDSPFYIRIGYGSHNSADGMFSYYGRLTPRDLLQAQIHFTGRKTYLDNLLEEGKEWKSHFYRTCASLNYDHAFRKVAFNLGGRFGLSNFNNFETVLHHMGLQKFTQGDAHIRVSSIDNLQTFQFKAGTSVMGYNRKQAFTNGETKEWQVDTEVELTSLIGDEQLFTIAADMQNLIYKNRIQVTEGNKAHAPFDDRTLVNVNPYYELSKKHFLMHLGAHADFSIGGGTIFRIAPDIQIQFPFSTNYVLYAQATGGRMVNDFRRIETLNPYSSVSNLVKDTYEQANFNIGLKASPVTELWFNIYGGYQNIKNDVYTGLDGNEKTYSTVFNQTNTSNWYAAIKASYQLKDIWSLSFESIYRNWKAKKTLATAEFNREGTLIQEEWNPALILKPRIECNAHMELHPINHLWFNLNYQFLKHEDHSYLATDILKIKDVHNLSCNLTYDILHWLSVYVQADNLLNKKYQTDLLVQNQGFTIIGGLCAKF